MLQNFLKPECSNKPTDEHTDIPTVKTGKFEEQNVKPNIPIGGKDKPPPARKVWTQLKSGLFGWKTLARPTIPSSGNKPRKTGTSAKTVTVFENSHVNKISKTRQYLPPKLIFLWGGRRVQYLTKLRKYTHKGIVIWRRKVRPRS